jgi:hypothetical protein
MTPQEEVKRIQEALAAPFPPENLGWKAQVVNGNRCLAVAFIDARDVMQRLNDVLGIDGWEDAFDVLLDGNVQFRLRARIVNNWVTKSDVGAQSDQPDLGDRLKSAVSDGLKRAAVKLGVAAYLYSLPTQWMDWDPQKKQIIGTPRLPAWAMPKARPEGSQGPRGRGAEGPRENGAPQPMAQRVEAADAAAVKLGLCKPGGLVGALVRTFSGEFGPAPDGWPEGKVKEAIAAFQADARSRLPATAEQTKAIDAELERTGENWGRCVKKFALPRHASLTDINQAQAAEVLAALAELTSA